MLEIILTCPIALPGENTAHLLSNLWRLLPNPLPKQKVLYHHTVHCSVTSPSKCYHSGTADRRSIQQNANLPNTSTIHSFQLYSYLFKPCPANQFDKRYNRLENWSNFCELNTNEWIQRSCLEYWRLKIFSGHRNCYSSVLLLPIIQTNRWFEVHAG